MNVRITRKVVRDVAELAAGAIFLISTPKVHLCFPKSRVRRSLKQGFRKLVPNRDIREVVVHFQQPWLGRGLDFAVGYLVHELLHAEQIFEGRLSQAEDGIVRYQDKEFWFHYNIYYKRRVICPRRSHTPLLRIPWEEDVFAYQEHFSKIVLKKFSSKGFAT